MQYYKRYASAFVIALLLVGIYRISYHNTQKLHGVVFEPVEIVTVTGFVSATQEPEVIEEEEVIVLEEEIEETVEEVEKIIEETEPEPIIEQPKPISPLEIQYPSGTDIPVEEEIEYWEQLPEQPLGYRPNTYYPDDVPADIWESAVYWGNFYDVSVDVICAIGLRETGLQNINSASGKYIGIMQVHPSSHKRRMEAIGVTDLEDVDQNIHTATHYLRELLNDQNDMAIALMRYHGEPTSNITRYLQTGEMSSYARGILNQAAAFEEAHGQGGEYE